MRLLVVTQYFWPENFRVNDLVSELVRRGHRVSVLTGWPNYPTGTVFPDFRRDPRAFSSFDGADVVRVPLVSRGKGGARLVANYASFMISASLLGSWRLRGREFDAIFVFEPSPITVGVPAALLRFLKRAPLTFWVLDLWPETLAAIGVVKSKRVLGLVGHVVRFVYSKCDLILAQSRSFIPQIAKYCRGADRIRYFPSWAEAVFDTASVVPAPEVPAKRDHFDVMFAGNIGDAQDFPSILGAAELLKDDPRVRWLIVGDGRMAPWVAAEIQRRGLANTCLMLGQFPVERMPSFFRCADVLLVSLKNEPIFAMTIPGKLQAYFAAGKPVVAMLNGEGAAVVAGSGAGLTCAAGDSVGLAAAVRSLASATPADLEGMARNARRVSSEDFDRDKLISRLESWLLTTRIGGPPAREEVPR